MTESAQLLRMLHRLRRRARALAAAEGAVGGAALGLAAVALAGALSRARGAGVPWRLSALAVGAATALGAALWGARRIPLVRCARLLDAALDRGARASDRVLSALSFMNGDAPLADSWLARAALSDAVARARHAAPAFVAPTRRPRALPALGGAALALLLVGAWPARAPGARRDVAGLVAPAADEPRLRVAAPSLDAERAEVVAAATAADAAGDVSLRTLAREARAILDALADGALGRGEALERLTALAARAKEAADETDAERAALRAAGKALEPTAATRALGRALGADDADATERALEALAARAEAADARRDIASALGAAAAGVASAAGGGEGASAGPEAERRRRLDRGSNAGGAPADGAPGDAGARRLERLRRDLEDSAAACRGDAVECASRLRNGAGELPGAAREAAETSARRRLENAVRQTRERLRRGDLEEGARGASERRFSRVAGAEARGDRHGATAGGAPRAGDGPAGGQDAILSNEPATGAGDGSDDGSDAVFVEEPGSGAGAAASADGEGAARSGQGAGTEAGGAPLGKGATPPTRGREREVRVRNGAGPTRSEVIEASARRGFAARDYVRVFEDYQPVVEEALASGAVPDGRRYVVRRYFQLIRPRADAAAPRAP